MKKTNNYLGIDIGGTAVKIGLITEYGEIIASTTRPVNFDGYKTPIITTVIKETDAFLASLSFENSEVSGIGVSATGQIDTLTGIVSGTAGHIDNWLGTPINQLLSEHYHLPVRTANDANCAVLGEQWLGAAKGVRNVVMVTIGTGVGGGIITDGRLLSGALGIAGELGHIPVYKNGKICSCGSHGCYEQYASTTALVKRVQESHLLDQTDQIIDGRLIFKELKKGNPALQSIVDEWISDIAAGLTGLVHIFNPELLLIGGGISRQQRLFIEPLSAAVLMQIMPGFRQGLSLRSAALGNNAGMLGAVAYFIHSLHERLDG